MPRLVAMLALLSLAASVHAEVTNNFEDCTDFFYAGFVPQGFTPDNLVPICQKYKGSFYFSTLYDTAHRIPVYSAYKFTKESDHRPNKHWLVEPQLVDQNWEPDMMPAASVLYDHKGSTNEEIGRRQALNDDYTLLPKGYNRGHLSPSSHHHGDGAKATFTLTNVVPQNAKMNSQSWSLYEGRFKTYCKEASCKEAYVVVGAVPSANNWVEKKEENKDVEKRVNIPDYMWQAFCCVDQNDRPVRSGAVVAKNTGERTLVECSVESLQQFLATQGDTVKLFDNCNAPAVKSGDCTKVGQTAGTSQASTKKKKPGAKDRKGKEPHRPEEKGKGRAQSWPQRRETGSQERAQGNRAASFPRRKTGNGSPPRERKPRRAGRGRLGRQRSRAKNKGPRQFRGSQKQADEEFPHEDTS